LSVITVHAWVAAMPVQGTKNCTYNWKINLT